MADLFPEPPQMARQNGTRGHRLPTDWQPTPEARQYAVGLGLDPDAVAEAFRDYWCDQVGARARRIDWGGTWRGWCRRTAQVSARAKPSQRANAPIGEPVEDEWWRRLKDYRPGKFWGNWGSRPEHGGSLVPPRLLARWKALLASVPPQA